MLVGKRRIPCKQWHSMFTAVVRSARRLHSKQTTARGVVTGASDWATSVNPSNSLDPARSRKRQADPLQDLKDEDEAVLYIHWPYCARRCSYCNFNKYISKSVDHSRMADCLERETKTLLHLSGVSKINSIFFGGGTPSLALPSTIARVVQTVQNTVTFTPGSEVTLEANPTHLETERLSDFRNAGVNRLSIGVQSLDDGDLLVLGRDHSVQEAVRCVEEARSLFPGRVSVDLMFGRPGQTLEKWTQELVEMLTFCDDHVSLYQLTLERGTQLFKDVQQNKYALPDSDVMAEMYATAVQMLQAAGLLRYEVSNFARKGAESQHNQSYWRGQQYVGVGPGAHSRFIPKRKNEETRPVREARIQTLEPANWMFEVEKYGHATRKVTPQTLLDQLQELVMLGLRTREGLTQSRWSSSCPDYSLQDMLGTSCKVQSLVQDGYLLLTHKGLGATESGIMVLDSIIPHVLAEIQVFLGQQDPLHSTGPVT